MEGSTNTSWGEEYDTALSGLLEEFYNQHHAASGPGGGRFISGTDTGNANGGIGGGVAVAEKPSAAQAKHVRIAQGHLADVQKIVGTGTKEGLVVAHTRRGLALYALGKAFGKGQAVSDALKAKFAAADTWLKTDTAPADKSLVHKLLQKTKAALSYVTGGNLRHFTYMNVAGNVMGLAAHFSGGAEAVESAGGSVGAVHSGLGWPPLNWHHLGEHVRSKIVEKIAEGAEHG